jgi:hypothetical protein
VDTGHGPGVVEVTTRYADTVSLTHAKGASTPLHVELREWRLAGAGQAIELPAQEFYVAQLVLGNVSTQISGVSAVRKPGEFWTVAKGARMLVTVKKPGEQALVKTFSVSPEH